MIDKTFCPPVSDVNCSQTTTSATSSQTDKPGVLESCRPQGPPSRVLTDEKGDRREEEEEEEGWHLANFNCN